jgi:hypothetical protein
MVLPSMRRFGPLLQPVPGAGVRRANSISSGSSASLIVSRENRLGVISEVLSRAISNFLFHQSVVFSEGDSSAKCSNLRH